VSTSMTAVSNLPKTALAALVALGTVKCMFVDAAFTPNQDTIDYINDVTNEATGTSYPAGGIVMSGVTITLDAATNKVTFDANNITTAALSVPCRWGFVYVSTGVGSTSPVVGYADFSGGGNVTVTEVDWDALGLFFWTVA
jgi:hypothetical protein